MAKIKNMGTATMRFKEGIILTGSAGETSDTLIVSGTSIFKDDMQMDVNKRIYFDGSSVSNGPFIYGNTTALFIDGDDRVTLSMDKDFRVLDNSNNTIMHITDKDATGNDVYKEFNDVNIFFSGSVNSIDGSTFGASAFGGDLVVSGVIQGKNNSLGMGTHDLHIGSKDNFLAFGSSFQFNQNNDNIGSPGDDVFLFMSGAIGGAGLDGVAVFGGDVVVSGSLNIESQASFEDYMIISVSADNTDLQTGTGLATFRAPFAMTLYQIPRASLTTNGTSQTTVDINVGGTTIMNTNKLTIDANEGTSVSAATSAALTTTNITDDQQITIDVDQAGTGARGLKVTLYYRRNI